MCRPVNLIITRTNDFPYIVGINKGIIEYIYNDRYLNNLSNKKDSTNDIIEKYSIVKSISSNECAIVIYHYMYNLKLVITNVNINPINALNESFINLALKDLDLLTEYFELELNTEINNIKLGKSNKKFNLIQIIANIIKFDNKEYLKNNNNIFKNILCIPIIKLLLENYYLLISSINSKHYNVYLKNNDYLKLRLNNTFLKLIYDIYHIEVVIGIITNKMNKNKTQNMYLSNIYNSKFIKSYINSNNNKDYIEYYFKRITKNTTFRNTFFNLSSFAYLLETLFIKNIVTSKQTILIDSRFKDRINEYFKIQ